MDSGQKKERLHFSQELINIFDVSGTCVKKRNQRNCSYQEERKKVLLSMFRCRQHRQGAGGIENRSDDVIKMKFAKLWDLLRYSERTTSKTPTRQKLAIRGKLSLRY